MWEEFHREKAGLGDPEKQMKMGGVERMLELRLQAVIFHLIG